MARQLVDPDQVDLRWPGVTCSAPQFQLIINVNLFTEWGGVWKGGRRVYTTSSAYNSAALGGASTVTSCYHQHLVKASVQYVDEVTMGGTSYFGTYWTNVAVCS